jgi:D-amino peptidase
MPRSGAYSAYEKTDEILVCDSHAAGENLLIDRLVRGVHLVRGAPRQYYMIEGINQGFDILFCIGYHAMVGTQAGGMDHTYSSSTIYGIRINDADVGETEINAAVAGYYGVPLGLVTGDDRLIKEVRHFFGKNVETVITKYGISRFAAKCRHPLDVHEEIERKAYQAAKKASRLKPFRFKKPLRAEFTLVNSVMGDLTEPIPGIKRVSARKLTYQAKDILDLYRALRMICNLARAT